jgi:hypothetical protein
MNKDDLMATLLVYQILAQKANRDLRHYVDTLAELIPFDLASDFVYEVIDLDRLQEELEMEQS